jgi:hypothetical protein
VTSNEEAVDGFLNYLHCVHHIHQVYFRLAAEYNGVLGKCDLLDYPYSTKPLSVE